VPRPSRLSREETTEKELYAMFSHSFSLSAVALLSLSGAACSSAPGSESVGKSGQAATADVADPSFTPCAFDSDCTAVPLAGCCHNGWLVAVNADLVCAYDDANACTVQNMMCAEYVVNDTRVALCDDASNACQMVAPASIACGGGGVNPHACPSGYDCVGGDGTTVGTCTAQVQAGDDAGTATAN
jgi:hypothetical protein